MPEYSDYDDTYFDLERYYDGYSISPAKPFDKEPVIQESPKIQKRKFTPRKNDVRKERNKRQLIDILNRELPHA